MARLIPSFLDDRTPPGEREVFNLLSAGPDNWVAIHSLDLAPWNRHLRTEIDFLIIVPDTGFVCVEVKSHENISFENDRWLPPDIKRSPFKQASDAKHTFYRKLSELAPQFRFMPVVHCCIFTRASFDIKPNLSIDQAELIDGRAFRAFRSGKDFCLSINARMRSLIEADPSLRNISTTISVPQVETIISLCVPIQKRRFTSREEIERREQDTERLLRDQQKPVLQLADLNDRLIISGSAGTGKTLIAMEVARRESVRGRRTALFCFNQLVGDWMAGRFAQGNDLLPNLIVGRAIRILADLTDVAIPRDPTTDFWEQVLPDKISDRLTDPAFKISALFDYLVVDEAQDLLSRPRLWDCVTSFLQGGVEKGCFCLFGDFDNQVLGARDLMAQELRKVNASSKPTAYRLMENCRNYRIVGDTAVLLSGIRGPIYDGYMKLGGGIQNYDIFFFDSDDQQEEKLIEWLKEFRGKGYRASEITILSFRSDLQSTASRLVKRGEHLRPFWQGGNATTFASVHAFKGLENKVVIITDVTLGREAFHRDLFYTGMTRACEYVRILCSIDSQKAIMKWLSER